MSWKTTYLIAVLPSYRGRFSFPLTTSNVDPGKLPRQDITTGILGVLDRRREEEMQGFHGAVGEVSAIGRCRKKISA